MGATFIQATLPHSQIKDEVFVRKNGTYTLSVQADPAYGIPYGTLPRIFIAWMTTEAVYNKSPILEMGDSLSGFIRKLGLVPSGGELGSIQRIKDQVKRLFTCSITAKDDSPERFGVKHLNLIDRANIWWTQEKSGQMQPAEFPSVIVLSHSFYQELIERPVPFRLSALKQLKQSPLDMDVYLWVTHKNSFPPKITYIKWTDLMFQFGVGYPNTAQGRRNFKKKFLEALNHVAAVYPEVTKLRVKTDYLMFIPGKPHVEKLFIQKKCE